MAKRLFDALTRPVTLRVARPLFLLGSTLLLALLISGAAAAFAPTPTSCEGLCQCWYCPGGGWGDPDGNGVYGYYCPLGGCAAGTRIGCPGACAYNDASPWLPGECSAIPGGGCGPLCECRSGDCAGGPPVPTQDPPTPVPTRETPVIPAACRDLKPGEKREWTNVIKPTIGQPDYRPDHPVALGQDATLRGFDIHLVFTGGRYEYKTQELEEWCGPAAAGQTRGRHPQDCPDQEYHYECPVRCTECYDDPIAAGQIQMRLADPTVDWIQQELAARYPGAQPKEGLPRVFQLTGIQGRMTYEAWWRYTRGQPDILTSGPLDPGIHGGQIRLWTQGTPKSPPQAVNRPFEAPVYLLDTTIAE